MNKEPPSFIAAHDRRDAVQPALPNRFRSVDDSQHPVLLVDALNQFTHEPHGARNCSRRPTKIDRQYWPADLGSAL